MKNNKLMLAGIVLASVLFSVSWTPAQDVASGGEGAVTSLADCDIPGLKNKINFDTKGQMDVVTFIETLASRKFGDLNVVISAKVKGSIRLSITDVSIADALEIALAANDLAYVVRGAGDRAIIKVLSDEEYRLQRGVGFYEQRKIKIIDLKYAQPSRVEKMLNGVLSSIGRIIFDDVTGTIILIDTPAKIAEMEQIIQSSEIPSIERQVPTITKVYPLKYANVADVEKEAAKLLTREVGKLTVDPRTKTVMVTDLENVLRRVDALILTFDRKPRQVAMQAKIVEVELSDDFNMGVNWNQVLDGVDPRFHVESKVPLSGASGPSLSYRTIAGGGDLSLVIDALKSIGDTKVISNPHISVLDGQEAMIKVIRKQPYKEIQYESGSTNIIGVSYQFIDIGTELAVTPKINDDGFMTVDIKPTISDLIEWYDAPGNSGGVVGIPVVKKSEASTTVVVKDGVTIIIGGMIKSENRQSHIGVPVLSSIPILGRLFESSSEKLKKTETIVFLTPKIITGAEPFLQKPDIDKDFASRGKAQPQPSEPASGDASNGKELKETLTN